jgi:hypothetical protein
VRPLPGRATLYRILTRNNLISRMRRKRRREDYIAWERPEPMELWQMDIVRGRAGLAALHRQHFEIARGLRCPVGMSGLDRQLVGRPRSCYIPALGK